MTTTVTLVCLGINRWTHIKYYKNEDAININTVSHVFSWAKHLLKSDGSCYYSLVSLCWYEWNTQDILNPSSSFGFQEYLRWYRNIAPYWKIRMGNSTFFKTMSNFGLEEVLIKFLTLISHDDLANTAKNNTKLGNNSGRVIYVARSFWPFEHIEKTIYLLLTP